MQAAAFQSTLSEQFPAAAPPETVLSELGLESRPESKALGELLSGKVWDKVGVRELNDHAEHIPALTFEAFQYYLPAFLTAAIEDPFLESATYTVYALCPLGNFDAYRQSTVMRFSEGQRQIIAEALKQLREHPSFETQTEELDSAIELWSTAA